MKAWKHESQNCEFKLQNCVIVGLLLQIEFRNVDYIDGKSGQGIEEDKEKERKQ